MNDVITKEITLSHRIDDVWKAISDKNEISAWFIIADFEPLVGYHYTFRHENTVINGEVLVANPVYELVYTWVVSGMPVVTKVMWKLEQLEDMTRLVLEHSGISNYEGETAVMMFTNFDGGWHSCLTNLEKHLQEVNDKRA